MGGCRCAYKNCTLRTDGVTHMFHFPVFDKVRCHQWLTNAEKLEFLNLKVSQLKNRVICQHHFKEDNFMNFKKDKLTFDAVPTEDGPFCDSKQVSEKAVTQDDSKLYTISLDDIENEYLTFNDKKANFSVKYGDFLTNCDMMDFDSFNLTNDTHTIKTNKNDYEDKSENILNDKLDQQNIYSKRAYNKSHPKNDKIYRIEITEKPVEFDTQANLEMPIIKPTTNVAQNKDNVNISVLDKRKEIPKKRNGKRMLRENKITILNEEKVSKPVQLPANLELINASSILPLPNKRKKLCAKPTSNDNNNYCNINFVAPDPAASDHINILNQSCGVPDKEVNNEKCVKSVQSIGSVADTERSNQNEIRANVDRTLNTEDNSKTRIIKKKSNSLLKSRIPPEKKAAIEEKRKFNIKLRDIITSCLDKLDEQEDRDYSSKLKSQIEKNITNKVSSYLAKEPELPNVQDFTVAYLEARMKKMEDILLNKIDNNTQRILEIKQLLSHETNKKAAYTQTAQIEEVHKKQLYQEISKYLSPDANSLLYEELFINKYVQKIPKRSPAKKSK